MRTMKDSGIEWIGQIPESWSVEALKRNVKIEMGQSPASECYNSDGVGFPFLQGNADFTDKFPVERMYTSAANKFSKTGDLLLSVRAPVGAVNIADKEYAIGRGLCAITGGRISIPFLWYAIAVLNHEFDANSTGSTFESINTEDVGNAKIMVPGEDEQRRITEYLDVKCTEIDALIAAKEKTNTLLKERRQSIIYEAVTKGLNPNAPMKDSGVEWIGEIPEEWETRRIKYCFDVFAGATPKSGNSEFWDGDVVWVTPADYTTEQKYITQGRKYITQEGFESCSTELIPVGSLIFSKRAPIGLVAINMVELCTNQGCLSCVPKDGNDVEYFYYAFSCFAEQFDLYGSGTTFKEISADAFVNFPIPFPSTEEQKEISEHLRIKCSELDTLISANEATIQKLKEYRQSIIYEAVTGKIEV